LILATAALSSPATARAASYSAYAGPNVFGPWIQVGAYLGSVQYSVSASPVGKTAIMGEVRYYGTDGQLKVESFYGSKTVTTCDCVGTLQVRFKGLPLGTAVNVDVK
jgi:hypothetical protein